MMTIYIENKEKAYMFINIWYKCMKYDDIILYNEIKIY